MYHGKESSTPKAKYRQGSLIHSLLKDSNSLCRSQPGGSRSQAEALEAEGVEVETNAMGEHSVDFSRYGWFPEVLPSEEDEASE
jgi:hypothetical protein